LEVENFRISNLFVLADISPASLGTGKILPFWLNHVIPFSSL